MSDFFNVFKKEWPVIKSAPFSFVTLMVIAVLCSATLMNWFYGGRIDALNEDISRRDARIAEQDSQLSAYKEVIPDKTLASLQKQLEDMKGRELTAQQRDALISNLKSCPSHVKVAIAAYDYIDTETSKYSRQIEAAFIDAQWPVTYSTIIGSAERREGFFIRLGHESLAQERGLACVVSALSELQEEEVLILEGFSNRSDAVEVYIGRRSQKKK